MPTSIIYSIHEKSFTKQDHNEFINQQKKNLPNITSVWNVNNFLGTYLRPKTTTLDFRGSRK